MVDDITDNHENLTESKKTTAENMIERERNEAENLVERELVEAENMIKRERIEAENMITSGRVEAENIMNIAFAESESIICNAVRESENIINHIVTENKNLKDNVLIEIKNLKETANIEIKNLKKLVIVSTENIKNIEKTEAHNREKAAQTLSNNLRRTAKIKAANLKQTAKVTAENLRRIIEIESANLKQTAKVTAENLRRTAEIESANLKQTANTISLNLIENAKITFENMKKIANVTSDNLLEHARINSLQTIKSTYNDMEQIKKIKSFHMSKMQNKRYLTVIITTIIIISGVSSFYLNDLMTLVPHTSNSLSTNYLIQNLRGDPVDTWVSWKKPDNGVFNIHIQNSKYVTQERLDAIFDAIMTDKKIELDNSIMHKGPKGTNSTYYVGWHGALNSITSDTKFNIIKTIHFHVDDEAPTGDIMIELTDLSNPDGYAAYTKSIVDEPNHQILKSVITVYYVDKINLEELKTLVRHELGHAFGLAHSTSPEDLMAPIITTDYPYISKCDLDAIIYLYDGGESSKVICEK